MRQWALTNTMVIDSRGLRKAGSVQRRAGIPFEDGRIASDFLTDSLDWSRNVQLQDD